MQLFPKCERLIPSKGIRGYICNGYYEVCFFSLTREYFVKNNRRTSLTGNVFIPYDRWNI